MILQVTPIRYNSPLELWTDVFVFGLFLFWALSGLFTGSIPWWNIISTLFEWLIKAIFGLLKLAFEILMAGYDVTTWIIDKYFLKPSKDFGSAQYLPKKKAKKLLSNKNRGLVIDGKQALSLNDSFKHLVVLGPTGSGKTTKFIIPNVLSIKNASMVVLDPSAEIYQLTASYLRKQKFRIKMIDVSDVESSLKYNPLHRATTFSEVQKIAETLVDTAFPKASADSDFWNQEAKLLITLLIKVLKSSPIHECNLPEVRRLLNLIGVNDEKLDRLVAQCADDDLFSEYAAFSAKEEKLRGGIVSTAKTALGKVSDPEIAELLATDDLCLEEMRKRPCVLFIRVPEEQIRYYSYLISLLYNDIFNYCMKLPQKGESYLPIFLLMDEFGNSGMLPSFSNVVTTARKRMISISIIVQDFNQIVQLYGKEGAATILNGGITSRLILPGISHEASEEVSRILGEKTISHSEQGYSRSDSGSHDKEMGRLLLRPDEIRCLPDHKAIFITGNQRPLLLNTTPYYRIKTLLKKTKK
ncbi:MAG: VirD4-like conjugal transfer protein, CD1115 family [Flammeovirgaceae bacterium]